LQIITMMKLSAHRVSALWVWIATAMGALMMVHNTADACAIAMRRVPTSKCLGHKRFKVVAG
jgi:hypothetical protein